jgi:hypothetical protein
MTVKTRRGPGAHGRRLRRVLAAAGAALVAAVLAAPPVSAHGGPGGSYAPASNYRSRVLRITPAVPGLLVRTIDAGARLELVNRTGHDVVVLGYSGEPYLRIGAGNPEVNVRSPAAYLNQSRRADVAIPPDADPEAPPRWQRSGRGPSARWHDHRTHWMGDQDPPAVHAAPGRPHRIDAWTVPLVVDGEHVTVSGDLTWVPPPRPWLPLAAAAALGAAVVAGALLWRWRAVLTLAGAALVAAAAVDATGVWNSTAEPAGAKALGLLSPLVGCAFVVGGLLVLRRAPRDGLAAIGGGAAALALASGLTSLDWLSRSQLPTALAPGVARATVVVAIGAGIGAAAIAAVGLLGKPVRLPGVPRSVPRLRAAMAGWAEAGSPRPPPAS